MTAATECLRAFCADRTANVYAFKVEAAMLPDCVCLLACSCTAQLGDIVGLVRGELPDLARATLSALVVMDVHARDVAAQLAAEGIEGQASHFSWLSQLRMYWEVGGPCMQAASHACRQLCTVLGGGSAPSLAEGAEESDSASLHPGRRGHTRASAPSAREVGARLLLRHGTCAAV
jgi:hypothetical protein